MADPSSNTKELLTLEVNADTKNALQEVTRFQRHIAAKMKKVQDSTGKVDKGFGRFMKQMQGARTRSKGIKDLTAQYKALEKIVNSRAFHAEAVRDARKAKRGSPERKRLMERVKEVKGASGYKEARSARGRAQRGAKELQDTAGFDQKDLRDGAEEAGESLAEPLRELLSKDAPTLMRRMSKILMGVGSKRMVSKGEAISERGTAMMARGGVAAKAGGGLTKLFGGLVKVLGSIGPILSIASSFMMSFIKILIDAEAAAKDYNKELLATTGTSSYLKRSFGDVTAATQSLENSLNAARDGAMDWSNVTWGITKETAKAFQTAITAEGVALDRLGNALGTATENADAHAKSIQMGVAYSRAFGVSLSEVAQMQGQLMADLGMGAKTVQTSFQTIVEGAEQAGMETNKFFGIIRTFSSDLSLFTLRLAELSKIMGVLGKTMDPRKMNQFVQSLHGKFEGGLMDNLKLTMMAGPGGRKIAKADAADKIENLRSDLSGALGAGQEGAIEELVKLVKDPKRHPKAIAEWQAKHQDKLNGTLNESIQQNANVQTRLASKNKIDQASVADELSPLRKLEMLQAASKNLTGRGFEELSGLSLAAVETAGIASAKEIKMFQRLQQGIMTGQASLVERLKTDTIDKKTGKHTKLTEADLQQLAALKIDPADKEAAKKLDALFSGPDGNNVYMKSLDKTQQQLLLNSEADIDYQKQIAGLQTSALDKLGIIVDALMNWIYRKMLNLWQSVLDIVEWLPGGDKTKERFNRAQVVADQARDTELSSIFASAGGIHGNANTQAIERVSGRAQTHVKSVLAERDALRKRLAVETDDAAKGKIQQRLGELKFDPRTEKYMQTLAGFSEKDLKAHFYEMAKDPAQGGQMSVTSVMAEMFGFGGSGGGTSVPAAAAAAAAKAAPAAAAASPSSQAFPLSVSPGVPSAAAAPAAAAAAAKAVEQAPTAAKQEATTKSVEELHRAVTTDGVKLNTTTISGPLSDTMAKSVYEGASKALFEYFMYSGSDRNMIAGLLEKHIPLGAITAAATSGVAPDAAIANLQAPGNAMGGLVTGVMNGMARIRPAPGEGLASVGRGERILSAGAGGGGRGGSVKVQLELKGDLKRFIDARVVEGAANHDRNRRLR